MLGDVIDRKLTMVEHAAKEEREHLDNFSRKWEELHPGADDEKEKALQVCWCSSRRRRRSSRRRSCCSGRRSSTATMISLTSHIFTYTCTCMFTYTCI